MGNFLTSEERRELGKRHRKEKNCHTADCIKAVLMYDNGWSFTEISRVLLLDEEIVSKHVLEYVGSKKLEIKT
ncbi:MAG: hypothetical protein LBB21_03855 [Holosporaceae bacterium]|jgi:hypothetical protein|nr:hypothetical protein [Holosporaceae bacterium]